MQRNEFLAAINGLAEVYNENMSELKLDLYFETLKDYSFEQFKSAIINILKVRVYPSMPKPSEIIECIGGKLQDRAVLAWETAIETAQKYDYYFTINFEDSIINGVIRAMGGWESFSTMPAKEHPFARKQFIELYEAYSRVGRECPEKLIGNFEKKNLAPEKIKFIKSDYAKKNMIKLENNRALK